MARRRHGMALRPQASHSLALGTEMDLRQGHLSPRRTAREGDRGVPKSRGPRSPAVPPRDPSLLVAQKSLLALQHLPQLRRTPLPQVLGSLGLEAAGQREHSAGAEAGAAGGSRLPQRAPQLAPDPRPAATPGHERESPFSRKNGSSSSRIELY